MGGSIRAQRARARSALFWRVKRKNTVKSKLVATHPLQNNDQESNNLQQLLSAGELGYAPSRNQRSKIAPGRSQDFI